MGFGATLATLIALAVVAIFQVRNIRVLLDDIIDVNGVKERYAINFRGMLSTSSTSRNAIDRSWTRLCGGRKRGAHARTA